MNKPTILKKYKNQLLSIVQESGLDPNLFTAEECAIDKDNYFVIALADSNILFGVSPIQVSFIYFYYLHSEFNPGFPLTARTPLSEFAALVSAFKDWLESVVKPYLDEVNAPDLWQMLGETRTHAKDNIGTAEDFKSFSEEEKLQVRLSINDFRLLIIKNFNPSKEALESVDARLKYLSEAVEKHNKFDWKGIAIQTVLSIIITMSLSPEQGSKLFQLFKEVFSHIIYLLPSA